jgi:hypothetical protein
VPELSLEPVTWRVRALAAGRIFVPQGSGAIVNVSSLLAFRDDLVRER